MAGGQLYNPRSKTGAGGRARHRPMSEINVTPFVDVMLVLLIIFMVTAPLMTVGVPVDLPKTKAANMNEVTEPLVVSLRADGTIFVQETQIDLVGLAPRLLAIGQNNTELRIFIRADQALNYGQVMQIMGRITEAGFNKVALLAENP
ncbi:MAG: protein TolR [Alphaproteobacteria bacterium]